MKPIKLATIGKVVWFFLIVIVIVAVFMIASLFKKTEKEKTDKPIETDSEKIIDYTESQNYVYDFEKGRGFKSKNNIITITESGTYKLQGKDTKYKILVDSPNSVVKLVLSSFDTEIVDDLIKVNQANRLIIELADGTKNSIISDLLEQEGVKNPTIISSSSNIDFIGNGQLKIETIGNFLKSQGDINFKEATLEINNINNGINIAGNFNMENGNIYIFSTEKGFVSGGNVTINDGTFIVRSQETAFKSDGIFLINAGKTFISSMKEIQKPNANSLQKTIILNFKEKRNKILLLHDTTGVAFAYAGGLDYQHILYSDEFKVDEYIIYGDGKIAGNQTYGIYKVDDVEENNQLTCESAKDDLFSVEELVNVYDDIVNK